jgi:hypothetical protein
MVTIGSATGIVLFGLGNPNTQVQSTVSINDGRWHNIALMRKQSKMSLYIDGVSQGSATCSAIARSVVSKYNVGISGTATLGQGINAKFSNIRIFNSADMSFVKEALVSDTTVYLSQIISWLPLKGNTNDYSPLQKNATNVQNTIYSNDLPAAFSQPTIQSTYKPSNPTFKPSSTPTTASPSTGQINNYYYFGCYTDKSSMAFRIQGNFTVDSCGKAAKANNYIYFGLEAYTQCVCSNNLHTATSYGLTGDCVLNSTDFYVYGTSSSAFSLYATYTPTNEPTRIPSVTPSDLPTFGKQLSI